MKIKAGTPSEITAKGRKLVYYLMLTLKRVKLSKTNSPVEPWMSDALLLSRKYKNKLESKKIKSPTPENLAKFKEYKRHYRSVIRRARLV